MPTTYFFSNSFLEKANPKMIENPTPIGLVIDDSDVLLTIKNTIAKIDAIKAE